MPVYKLILYPESVIASSTADSIVNVLKKCGLIAGDMVNNYYLVGDDFLTLLSFLGCAPNISLTPQAGENFCHIVVNPWQASNHYLGHNQSAVPRCPNCKHKLANWQQIAHWQNGETLCTCPQCQRASAMRTLNWKQQGGYGCMAVEIFNIHPFEAVPSDELLDELNKITQIVWRYCYATSTKEKE